MAAAHDDARRIIIVMGPGRSGTSTVAGALAMSGLEVPGESIKGNPSNPTGFYEPRWVVDLHKEFLKATHVADLDTSPLALKRIGDATGSPEVRARLQSWLVERLEAQPRLVVKDPRAVWFHDLWSSTCGELGIVPGYVTMLRHPAEVAGSRDTYYQRASAGDDRRKQIVRIAGWINVALTAEQVTTGQPRNFVRYTDLVADWRKILTRIAHTNDFVIDPATDLSPHPVDEFIDPTLHRVKTDWDYLGVPEWLSDLGERTWLAMTALADSDSAEGRRRVDDVRREHAQLVDAAEALTSHETRRRERDVLVTGRRTGRENKGKKPNQQRRKARRAARVAASTSADGS
jgi:hypothetical protein